MPLVLYPRATQQPDEQRADPFPILLVVCLLFKVLAAQMYTVAMRYP